MANFRAGELSRWLAERRGDAAVASRDSVIAAAAVAQPAQRVSTPAFVAAGRRLAIIARSYGYEAVSVVDKSGVQLMGHGTAIAVDHPDLKASIAEVMKTAAVQMDHLVWSTTPPPGEVKLDVVAPLVFEETGGQSRVVGALVLRIDLRDITTAVLGLAAAASPTGEMTLVARSRRRTIALFPKRWAAGKPWIVVQEGGAPGTAEAMIAAGHFDLSHATAESGAKLVAVSTNVAGAPWTVVGKAQIAEFIGPSLRALWLTCGLVATLLLGLVLLSYSLWKRRSERILRSSEEKFRNIFQNMQDGYLFSNVSGEIRLVNPAAVRMLGYDNAIELLGKDMERDVFVNPSDRVALKALLHARGVVHGHKTTFKRRDGSQVIVEGHVRLVRDHQGTVTGIEGVMRDMSSHYEVREELIRAREAALSAAEIKSQFLANMSHEIRTPLNAIVGLGHLLARADLTPQLAGYVSNIQSSIHMLLDVVNNVLDFSKIEAGRLTLEAIPFRLDEVVRGVENLLAFPARSKGLELICTIDERIPKTLYGDPVRLGQVLTNLVDNGVKFTAAGKVCVAVELMSAAADRATVRFTVSDTGIGIAPERASAMFEPFVQADGSTTRRFGGTGLGLAICRQLVVAMGGDLAVTSAPGEGSRFVVTIEFACPVDEVAPTITAARSSVSLRGVRILVAEDNAINQQVARELLEGAGATVVIADGGRAAINLAITADPPFDAVLMDLQMPGTDGFEAARAIRKHETRGAVPIIAMTAHAFDQEKAKCLAAGMNDHIAKPVEPDRLFATLLRWVGKSQDGPPQIDLPAGLRRVGGDHIVYRRLLGVFADQWCDGADRLRGLLVAGQIVEARRLAHTLKGTAATLGADAVSAHAAHIEATLGEAGPLAIDPHLDQLAGSLRAACAAIARFAGDQSIAPATATAARAALSPGPVFTTITELETLLVRRNLRAREAVDRLRNTPLPARCQGPLAQVVGRVARLEYAEAAVALAELKAMLSEPQRS